MFSALTSLVSVMVSFARLHHAGDLALAFGCRSRRVLLCARCFACYIFAEQSRQNSPVFASNAAYAGTATSSVFNRWFTYVSNEMVQDWDGGSTHRDGANEFTYSTSTGNLTRQVERGEVSGNSDGTYSDTGSDARFTTFT